MTKEQLRLKLLEMIKDLRERQYEERVILEIIEMNLEFNKFE